MSERATERLHELGQSIWLDNITRALLDSGQLQMYLDDYSVTGLTSNPAIFDKAISSGAYDEAIQGLAASGKDREAIFFELAIDAGLSAYAAPLGPLEQGAASYAGQVPLILKLNSANSLAAGLADQAVTATVDDALRLGCIGVGFTIYPGSDACYAQQEELREITREAKAKGLLVVVWSYPRGGKVSKEGETALDIVAYAAHMAALMGAHVIKVKPPTARIDLEAAKPVYEKAQIPASTLGERVAHVMQAAFAGKRLVVFSGGEAKDTEGVLAEIRQIRDGGGHGSIIGRNSFQRRREDALQLLDSVIRIYQGKA